MTNYLRTLICGIALSCGALPAYANWLYTPGAGPSAFVSFNSGTTPAGTSLCAAANTDCLANVPINLAGNPLFVTGNAGLVTGTGGVFPASQSGTWTVQPGNTANTTPWLFSITVGGNTAAVKAGNTAATTDVALVVSDPNLLAAANAAIPVGANSIGGISVTPTTTNPTSTLTMPAATTAYTAGQLIANNATAGSVVVPSFAIANAAGAALIPRLRLATNDSTSTAWGAQTVQVDLWSAAPTFTNGDRGAFLPATGTGTHYGSYSCTISAEYGDGAFSECIPLVGNFSLVKIASGTSIFWTLQAISGSGVTGASKVWTLTAELMN